VFCALTLAALFVAPRALASDDPLMDLTLHVGPSRSPRGYGVRFGYSMGLSIDRLYVGVLFSALLGPSHRIGVDSTGQTATALDTAIFVGPDVGYEQVVEKHFFFRASLALGGFFYSREIRPDSADRYHENGFGMSPSLTFAGLVGPVLIGIEQRGVLTTTPTEPWSHATMFVIGSHWSLPP